MDTPSREDAELVAAAQQGEREAFGCLVERYQDRVYNVLARVLDSREDALDVTQEAFIQAFVKLNSFRGEAKFYTWLYRIALNLGLSKRRRRRSSISVEQVREQGGEEPVSLQPAPENVLMVEERAATLERALSALEADHCQILVLREIEQCSYEEISEILELPIGTVRSRIFRARIQLKEKLKELMPDEVDQE